jgi:hypothetical protein
VKACEASAAGKRDVQRGTLALLALAACGAARMAGAAEVGAPQTLAQQETCYSDDSGRIVRRRAPGFTPVPCPPTAPANPAAPGTPGAQGAPAAAPQSPGDASFPGGRQPPSSVSPLPRPQITDYVSSVPLPDRWRIVDELGYKNNWLDPYNRNLLKADRPLFNDWFFNLGIISDSLFEYRQVPIGVGGSSTRYAGENDVFGNDNQRFFSQNVAVELEYFKGDTVFKPPDYEFRLTPVFNYNYTSLNELEAVNVNPQAGVNRSDEFVGLQEAFFDMRVRDVSERFDFDSVRIGIQPFSSDFRGFLFQDNQLGARLFGTRDNNLVQYNLAYFRLLEKDTNSGLNDVTQSLRRDDVFVFNIYRQDMPSSGFTSQLIVLYNRDREGSETHYDKNGFIVIPEALGIEQARDYDAIYLGYNGDGHFGRLNLTTSLYYVTGRENPGTFVDRETHISAFFAAAELSRDFSWVRTRLSLLYASGDNNPYDDRATGFDAVFENPQFAGGDTSYWIRQAVPLIGGGGVTLSGPDGILNDLRSSKGEGQSNFTNPGVALVGIGADFDLLPTLRLSFNANDLWFAATQTLEAARNQGGIGNHIGEDLSAAFTWRPLDSQNIVLRASYAKLISGGGFLALFPGQNPGYLLLDALFAF